MADEPLKSTESVLSTLTTFAFDDDLQDSTSRTPVRRSLKKVTGDSSSPAKRPRVSPKRKTTPRKEPLQRHRGFSPSIGESPRVLILGSAPCEMSLEKGQFYGNPRNHFWAVMAYAMDDPQFAMLDYETRCSVLRSRGIALWNICEVFSRYKSSDATLHCEEFANIAGLILQHPTIHFILCNGTASYDNMVKYDLPGRLEAYGITAKDSPLIFKLPSTSPANAMANPVETKGTPSTPAPSRSALKVSPNSSSGRSLPPILGENPRVLILGSAPSQISLARGEYYANPHNHFWGVLGFAMDDADFSTLDYISRCEVLKNRGIAVWDVCDEFTRHKRQKELFGPFYALPLPTLATCSSSRSSQVIQFYRDSRDSLFQAPNVSVNVSNDLSYFRALDPSIRIPDITRVPSTSPAHAMANALGAKGKVWKEKLQDIFLEL
ncbi:hypothetical protein FOL47_009513 [Perkinsus chesapeaki]|uniref:Uracil-DNA glycosylase-like domain-containing protein n=1 Tax=Perkinsus chesapeaki TaxID=330153 RepID=A0A7J6MRP0_PERCH|nr:hypothetical protein FOL47_009513 [Perkinsus chesapeaki]